MRITQKYTAPLLLLAVTLLAGLLTSPWLQVFGIDREVFRYSGMAIVKGELLYRDLFDHKPPLIHLLYAATSWLGPWGDWLLFRLLHWMAAWMLYKTACTIHRPTAFITPLLWLLLMNYPPVVTDGGNTREQCACLATMLFCTGIGNGRYAFVLMGVLAGFIFCTQQNEILPLAPPLLYFLLQPAHNKQAAGLRTAAKRALQFTAGFLPPVLLMAGWLLATRNWSQFVYHAFTFNTQWYIPATDIYQNLFHVLHKLRILNTGWLMLLAVPLGILAAGPRRWLALAFTASLGLAVVSAMLGHNFNHYYTAFVPGIVMLTVFPLSLQYRGNIGWPPFGVLRQAQADKYRVLRLAVPVLAVALCAGGYWKHISNARARNYWLFAHNPVIDQKLETVCNRHGQLFVFNNPQGLQYNHRFGIVSPSRWMYQHVWRWPTWDTGFSLFRREVLQPLERFETRFILYHETDLRLARPALVDLWEAWLNERYVPVVVQMNEAGDVLRLYERRGSDLVTSYWLQVLLNN